MTRFALILLALVMLGCAPESKREGATKELSLFDEHDGLTLPEEMQRELGVELIAVTDTNRIPESAIIRGAKDDFTYVKDGKHFVRTALADLAIGNQIVSHGVKDLWLIELLAIRGGEPCCPAGD